MTTFAWNGPGPISWAQGLSVLETGDGSGYVLQWFEERPLYGIAVVEPAGDTATFASFFEDLLSENGKAYGTELFWSLPEETTSYRPDLVPAEVVAKSFWRWTKWAEQNIWGRGVEGAAGQAGDPGPAAAVAGGHP